MRHFLRFLVVAIGFLLLSCTTTITNSDGTIVGTSVDKNKLAEIYTNLAIEYQNKGSLPIALSRANLAIENNSDYAKAYMVRATIYQQLKKPNLAMNDFNSAIKLDKISSDIKTNYAIFLCEQRDYATADQLFIEALNNPLYETPAIAYLASGNCNYIRKKYKQANEDYLQALTYKKFPHDIYVNIAKLQYEENNYKLADFYIQQYHGVNTASVLLLRIQILNKLMNENNTLDNITYVNTIKLLGDKLIKNFPNSSETQTYLQGIHRI